MIETIIKKKQSKKKSEEIFFQEKLEAERVVKETIVLKKQWTVAMCINHWAMAVSIVMLIITGFYISIPFTIFSGETWQKFFMANMRFIHLVFGLLLTVIFIWRIYLAFFSRFHADWKDFFAWLNVKNLLKNIKFYALITNEPPEHTALYGPLQSLAYGSLFVIVFFEVITGLILYRALQQAGMAYGIYAVLRPVEGFLGGLAGTRFIHHILTWALIIFIFVHTYMAFWYDIVFKEGSISSIVNGIIFKHNRPH